MGKRSSFDRNPRDFYPTPIEAVKPLVAHLPKGRFGFDEPCAGDGRLVDHIFSLTDADVSHASDIEPLVSWVDKCDVFDYKVKSDLVITNPPWDRKILHPIIDHFRSQAPIWLLFDADWMHTKQSSEYMKYCKKVVSVGRVKWIEDSRHTGKDNCCWYLFDDDYNVDTIFYGR